MTTTQQPNFIVSFTRNGVTVDAFSKAVTHKGAILDATIQARRADKVCNESAIYGGFVARPVRACLA